MKILIYGAGVVGSQYAAHLRQAGHDVTLLARGRRLADLQDYGIVIEDALTGMTSTTRVALVDALAPADAYDLVLVTMGRHQIPSVLPALAANRYTPSVAFLSNNACGAQEYVEALGRERVLIGFPDGAGGMHHHVVHGTLAGTERERPLGEPDGRMTARVDEIASTLRHAGLAATPSAHADAWLKTHAALIVPLAGALYAAGGLHTLPATRDALLLAVRAVRENLRVLRALDVPILPSGMALFHWLPEPLVLAFLRSMLANPDMAIAFEHADGARPEMLVLAAELRDLSELAGVRTPAMDRLVAQFDPRIPPFPYGSANIPIDWRGTWLLAASAASLLWLMLRNRPHNNR